MTDKELEAKAREILDREDDMDGNWREKTVKHIVAALKEASRVPDKVREALEFYANPFTWSDNRNIYYFDVAHPSDMEISNSQEGNKVAGKRAREALALLPKKDGG